MLKENGTIIFDDDRNTFYNSVSDTKLKDLEDDYVPWPRNFNKRALKNDKVQLTAKLKLFLAGSAEGSSIPATDTRKCDKSWCRVLPPRGAA